MYKLELLKFINLGEAYVTTLNGAMVCLGVTLPTI